jgi:acyl carrier protein
MDNLTASEIIFGAIAEVNLIRTTAHPGASLVPLLHATVLSGENPAVDSLELITILTSVEEQLAHEGTYINLADDAALDKEPWETVATLRDFIVERINDSTAT